MWKYDKAFLDYVYKIAEQYIQYHPLDSKQFKKVHSHFMSYMWFVLFNVPIKKPKRCFGMSVPEMIKDKRRMKEILQIALDNKNKTNVIS